MPPGENVHPDRGRPRSLRLNRSGEFLQVKQAGRTAVGPFFRISALRLEPGPPTGTLTAEARVGIITTKRLGNAVRRNRCRRRIRELHRSTRHLLAPGTWLVVIARSECATAPWADLETEWLRLLAKLSIVQRS